MHRYGHVQASLWPHSCTLAQQVVQRFETCQDFWNLWLSTSGWYSDLDVVDELVECP